MTTLILLASFIASTGHRDCELVLSFPLGNVEILNFDTKTEAWNTAAAVIKGEPGTTARITCEE